MYIYGGDDNKSGRPKIRTENPDDQTPDGKNPGKRGLDVIRKRRPKDFFKIGTMTDDVRQIVKLEEPTGILLPH